MEKNKQFTITKEDVLNLKVVCSLAINTLQGDIDDYKKISPKAAAVLTALLLMCRQAEQLVERIDAELSKK